jgi:AcrR family transcriptional regulator
MASTGEAKPHPLDDADRARRQPGRPRNAEYDKNILDAARQILVEQGYAGFTIDGVAARSGVSRPTIYRRWPSKAALAIAVINQDLAVITTPDTGSLRDDLRAFQHERLARMNRPAYRPIIAGLVSDSTRDSVLAEGFLVAYQPRREAMAAALQRAIERGELRPGVDFELVNDLLLGPLFIRSVVRGEQLEPKLVDETVDAVLAAFGRGTRRELRASGSSRRRGTIR